MTDCRASPELIAALEQTSREFAALVEPAGVVRWADARAERLGIAPPRNLIDAAVPGGEDQVRELMRRGCCSELTGWELPLVIAGQPVTAVFSARPWQGGAALLGSLIAQDHADAIVEGRRAMHEIVALNRELAQADRMRAAPLHSILGLSRLPPSGSDGALTAEQETQVRFIRDSTDLLARNAALIAADRRKDEFLAMLAHELRNPLAAIRMGLPLLDRNPPRDAVEGRAREVMRRQAGLLTRLVDDLLDVSRVTRNRIELQLADVDLARLVTQVCDGFRPRVIEPRSQQLVVEIPGEPVIVAGDAGRLEQVLTNLLDNASKYSDPRTRIEVALRTAGGAAELRVRDHGIGIDAQTLPSVFELFAQAQTSLDRSHGGLGIGLTLVKALVELHGGQIEAASVGTGHGTTITVRLPLRMARSAAEPVAAAPAPDPGACSVLVIDDNEDGREMLRCLCELHGHRVLEAGDGEAGVVCAIEGRPDIAFIDIGLPTIDGYEVARRVRAKLGAATPRLVALSGYGSHEHRARALEAGFDAHVAKPIDIVHLHREIAAAKKA
ncbi:MAG TPA: hybrid sensor histidine kinase/response regulator [Kofleriaceae bacterium]|nr:hybrid sensor histidine kinase/response regulator [Kofleriaceae bacterium]